MRKAIFVTLLMLCLVVAHVRLLHEVGSAKLELPVPQDQGYVLPGSMLRLMAGEFRSLSADLFFLKGIVAFGRTLEQRMDQAEKNQIRQSVFQLLDASTDLDPYFFDPYYFANAALSQDPAMVPKINQLLEKGLHRRDWDWMLPFFLGFNYFYYLGDNSKAAEYLMIGAERPNAIPLLATLAARLIYQENRTENAIIFLRGIISKTKDEKTRQLFQTRLKALQHIFILERAVRVFHQRYSYFPQNLNDLLTTNILAEIPQDPYGGTFFLGEDGSVKSTSELTYAKGGRKSPTSR